MDMPQAQHTVTVRRPVEAVFDFVTDGENCPQWRPGVLDIKRVSGDGVGTVYRQGVRGPMGRRIAADYRVTTLEPNRVLTFETIAGPVRPRGRYEFEPQEGATRLTFSLEAEVRGLTKLLMGSMVSRTMASEVMTLENLKRILEA
jgi:carbon monoxide dehydrogenase subunit G